MKTKIGSVNLYIDTASNLIIEAEYVDIVEMQKAIPKDKLQDGLGYVIIALVREFKEAVDKFNDRCASLIKEC